MSNGFYGDFERHISEDPQNEDLQKQVKIDSPNILVCEQCGSDEVEELAWVDVNTKEYMGTCDYSEFYCRKCEDNVDVLLKSGYIK